VDPVQPPRDPGAGLVEVGDLGPAQQVTDPLHKPAQPLRGLGQEPTKHASRAARAQPARKNPAVSRSKLAAGWA
jgi:hypothetical protein